MESPLAPLTPDFFERQVDKLTGRMSVFKTEEFWMNAGKVALVLVVVLVLGYAVMYAYKRWKRVSPPHPVVPKQPEMEDHAIKPEPIIQTNELEPVAGIADDDMRSLCAHIKPRKSVDEIITSSDFSELVNAEQACAFAKHQYVDMPVMPRGTGKAAPNEEIVALAEFKEK
jgi:hypothetical protein